MTERVYIAWCKHEREFGRIWKFILGYLSFSKSRLLSFTCNFDEHGTVYSDVTIQLEGISDGVFANSKHVWRDNAFWWNCFAIYIWWCFISTGRWRFLPVDLNFWLAKWDSIRSMSDFGTFTISCKKKYQRKEIIGCVTHDLIYGETKQPRDQGILPPGWKINEDDPDIGLRFYVYVLFGRH